MPYMYRISGLSNTTHTVVYTCTALAGGNSPNICLIFGAAAVGSDEATADGPFVYSLSPIKNAPAQATGNMADSVTSTYYDLWKQELAELRGDGLQIVGLDATNPTVYNPANSASVQADGIHPSVSGHAGIGAAAGVLGFRLRFVDV